MIKFNPVSDSELLNRDFFIEDALDNYPCNRKVGRRKIKCEFFEKCRSSKLRCSRFSRWIEKNKIDLSKNDLPNKRQYYKLFNIQCNIKDCEKMAVFNEHCRDCDYLYGA